MTKTGKEQSDGALQHPGRNGHLHPARTIEDEVTGILRYAQDNIQHGYEECEERVRKSPGPTLLSAFACGYVLRSLPVEAIVTAQLRLLLSLVRPALFLYGTAKVYEFIIEQTSSAKAD